MRKVVVIGGSAGGLRALCHILKDIPGDFAAPLLVVLHLSQESTSLGSVLQKRTSLKVVSPQRPVPIRTQRLYLAPANRHLIVTSGCAMSAMGPRENCHRPSVDVLFRSAARAYRDSAIAVVLSGGLDDGSAGALAIKARGGMVIVQDPKDAEVPDMPANVIRQVKVDRRLSLDQIPEALREAVSRNDTPTLLVSSRAKCAAVSQVPPSDQETEPIGITCPDCGGELVQIRDGKTLQWRCHVGHRFSLKSLSEGQADALERAVWIALRKLKEKRIISQQLSLDHGNSMDMRKRFSESAVAAAKDIRLLEQVLTRL